MGEPLPVVYLARHGDTAWTQSGQHTGRTDLFELSPASLSALGYEHNLSQPVVRFWNDDRHVIAATDR